jgi:hypothetical protein
MVVTHCKEDAMSIDWSDLAQRIHSSWSAPQDIAREALDRIVGTEAIRAAVELAVDFEDVDMEDTTWEHTQRLAEYTLVKMESLVGSEWAHAIYRNAPHSNKASAALHLIYKIGHPRAFDWIPEFLADGSDWIGLQAMELLDYFITEGDRPLAPEDVEPVLELAAQHTSAAVRARVAVTRMLLEQDSSDLKQYFEARDKANSLGLEG